MKKLLIVILGLSTSLILYEVFLTYSPFEYGLTSAEYDKDVGMWHKKNFSSYKIKECYKTKFTFDDRGLVKNMYKYNINKKDVIILGDSRIEAQMVENKNIIHNRLSLEYNHKYNFLNYGLYMTGPVQQYVIVDKKVDLSKTKYILQFVNIDGDLYDSEVVVRNSLGRPLVRADFLTLEKFNILHPRAPTLYDKIGGFLGNFQLYSYIKRVLYTIKKEVKQLFIKDNKQQANKRELVDSTKAWLNVKGSIYQLNKLALNNNIEYKIIIYYETLENNKILVDFLKEQKIKYTILNNEVELNGFSCDKHWNDNTHINIAKYLRKINFIE